MSWAVTKLEAESIAFSDSKRLLSIHTFGRISAQVGTDKARHAPASVGPRYFARVYLAMCKIRKRSSRCWCCLSRNATGYDALILLEVKFWGRAINFFLEGRGSWKKNGKTKKTRRLFQARKRKVWWNMLPEKIAWRDNDREKIVYWENFHPALFCSTPLLVNVERCCLRMRIRKCFET